MRQTAYTEGFNDQSGIRWKKSIQYFPVNPWNQFEQKNLLIHLMIKHQWLGGLVFVINIKNNLLIVNGCNIRIINAGKGIVAFGKFLLCSGSCDHFSPKHNGNSMSAVVRGKAETVQKIGTCICNCQVNRFLCTGNHDRSAVILDQIRQSSSRICHSVRSMAKHKAIIKFIFGFDQSGQLQPMVCAHIGTVQGKRLNGINGAEFPGFRNIFQQLICGNLRCQPLCCIFGSNGSPGCNKKYLFHVVPLCNCYPHVQSAVPAFSQTLLCSEKLFS